MFDFKNWRVKRRMTQGQAGALLGASSSFWSCLEAGKIDGRKAWLIADVLIHQENPAFQMALNQLCPQVIADLLNNSKAQGITYKESSIAAGFGRSTLGNFASGNNDWNTATYLTKALIVSFILKCQGIIPTSEKVKEEELVSVTVPATAEMPERTFTPADVVVHVGEPVGASEGFERIEHIMLNGVPMWRLADVCRAIDYKNITEAKNLVRLADLEKSKLANSNGQIVEQWLVNEYGLLRILAKANTPKTEEFERWVFEEVLPAIRKTGSYHAQPQAPTLITALEMQLQAARQLEAQQRQIDAMQAQVKQLAASTVTIEQVATIASAKTVEAHEKHRSDVYYVDKHVKNAAKELTIKVHGRMTAENGDIWKAHRVSKIKELNKSIREAVAKNYACHPKQAPGRDRYSNADKRTAYEALNRWRELNGLQMQLALSLEA